jgi:hypothetical protein
MEGEGSYGLESRGVGKGDKSSGAKAKEKSKGCTSSGLRQSGARRVSYTVGAVPGAVSPIAIARDIR